MNLKYVTLSLIKAIIMNSYAKAGGSLGTFQAAEYLLLGENLYTACLHTI